jgi:hypothetical protein
MCAKSTRPLAVDFRPHCCKEMLKRIDVCPSPTGESASIATADGLTEWVEFRKERGSNGTIPYQKRF